MTAFLDLLDRLAALGAPSVLAIQGLLGTPLAPTARQDNRAWTCYAGAPSAGAVRHIDLRVPGPGAALHRPFLVLALAPGELSLDQLRQRYGRLSVSDLSAHHPDFVGYSFVDGELCLAANVGTGDGTVLSVAIDYARTRERCRSS